MLTSSEVASLLGVDQATVRKWVNRGVIRPQRPGARPLTFWPEDVGRLQASRTLPAQRAAIEDIWAEVDHELAGQHGFCHDTA